MKLKARAMLGLAGGLVSALVACAPTGEVTRVVDGRVVVGRVIEDAAYASFLRGALAEDVGALPVALEAYTAAASADADDPEIWTRIGDLRCRLAPGDAGAHVAFSKALELDRAYEPALEARARCETSRGEGRAAEADQELAADADPKAVAPQVLLASAVMDRFATTASRNRLVALTLLHSTTPAAWYALATWAETHHDAMLVVRALGKIARLAPRRKWELAGRAVALAGDGELAAARALAAALLDVPGDRSAGGEGPAPAGQPLVARLAVDEAIVRGDIEAARRRATSAHLGLDVVAGRALLLGNPGLARELAGPLLLADPDSSGARMALAVAAYRLSDAAGFARALARSAPTLRAPPAHARARVAPEVLLPFAKLVEAEASPEEARAWLASFPPSQLLPGDAPVTSVAVDLAALGAMRDEDLPLDARIELAARRSEPLPRVLAGAVDARHLLFARALETPLDAETLALAQRLGPASADDPLVAVALARLSMSRGGSPNADALDRILAIDPADPILAAAALDLAKRSGDARAIAPLRARLTALARTQGERAHALE
jgi:hypothetical protein